MPKLPGHPDSEIYQICQADRRGLITVLKNGGVLGLFIAPWRVMDRSAMDVWRPISRRALAFWLFLAAVSVGLSADVSFPVLHAGTKSYTNAVVTLEKGGKVLLVRHAVGMASIKVADIDDDARERLGLARLQPKAVPAPGATTTGSKGSTQTTSTSAVAARISNPGLRKVWDAISSTATRLWDHFELTWIDVLLGLSAFAMYVTASKACWDLCRRAGFPSSIAVWLPVFKRLALFKAVGLSRVWFVLGAFIPFVGFFAWIACCLRLCDLFRRTRWLVWPMLFPPLAPLAFISLANSSREVDNEPAMRKTNPRGVSIEGIIAGDLPLRALKKTYPEAVTGLIEYGNAMHRLYYGERYIDCEICKTKPTSEVQAYEWVAKVRPGFSFGVLDWLLWLLGFVGVKVQERVLEFETAHYLCASCVKTTRMNRALAVPVKGVAFFILVVSVGATIMGLGGVAWMFNAKAEWDMGFVSTSVAGIAGLIAGWIGHKFERSLRIPFPFRTIDRPPFRLSKVRVISTASEREKAFEEARRKEEFSAA
jgi:hypothetical protein